MTKASQWNHRVNRLLSMDRHELLDRLRQRLTARADVLRYRGGPGFASSPHLGPVELTGTSMWQTWSTSVEGSNSPRIL